MAITNGYNDEDMAKNYHCRDRKLEVTLFRGGFLRFRKLGFDFLVTFISILCFRDISVKLTKKQMDGPYSFWFILYIHSR